MQKERKYLCIEFHDNDFTLCWYTMGNYIRDIVWSSRRGDYPELSNKKLDEIKEFVARIMWAHNNMVDAIYRDEGTTDYDYFEKLLQLSIVDFSDIPDWDSQESMYISLYKEDEEVIIR